MEILGLSGDSLDSKSVDGVNNVSAFSVVRLSKFVLRNTVSSMISPRSLRGKSGVEQALSPLSSSSSVVPFRGWILGVWFN